MHSRRCWSLASGSWSTGISAVSPRRGGSAPPTRCPGRSQPARCASCPQLRRARSSERRGRQRSGKCVTCANRRMLPPQVAVVGTLGLIGGHGGRRSPGRGSWGGGCDTRCARAYISRSVCAAAVRLRHARAVVIGGFAPGPRRGAPSRARLVGASGCPAGRGRFSVVPLGGIAEQRWNLRRAIGWTPGGHARLEGVRRRRAAGVTCADAHKTRPSVRCTKG